MSDLISRQAVDELSKELVHTTRDKADFLCNFWERLQKLPSVENKGEWISVSERLPEKDGQYLVTYDREDEIKVNISYFDRHGFWIGNVVAWMPLPEPYKAESEE